MNFNSIIFNNILFNFLSLSEFKVFDTACTQQKIRKEIIGNLDSFGKTNWLDLNFDFLSLIKNSKLIQWLTLKGLFKHNNVSLSGLTSETSPGYILQFFRCLILFFDSVCTLKINLFKGSIVDTKIGSCHLHLILQLFPNMNSLSFDQCLHLSDRKLMNMMSSLKKLIRFQILKCPIDYNSRRLEKLNEYLNENLKEFHLDKHSLFGYDTRNISLEHILSSFIQTRTSLTSFNISFLSINYDDNFLDLLSSSNNLQKIVVANIKGGSSIQAVQKILLILKSKPNLQSLILKFFSGESLNFSYVKEFSKNELILTGNQNISSSEVLGLLSLHYDYKTLHFSHLFISLDMLTFLHSNFVHVICLKFVQCTFRCTADELLYFFKRCNSTLQKVTLESDKFGIEPSIVIAYLLEKDMLLKTDDNILIFEF
jgi:hypothetical protein